MASKKIRRAPLVARFAAQQQCDDQNAHLKLLNCPEYFYRVAEDGVTIERRGIETLNELAREIHLSFFNLTDAQVNEYMEQEQPVWQA